MNLYNKYIAEKEKYVPVYKNMSIFYNKDKNSITYKDGQGYSLVVQYTKDMKIKSVYSITNGEFGTKKVWSSLNKLLENLGSDIWYYNFSSNYNPYNEVTPLHFEAMENQGLFDVMMATANTYIKENNKNVILGVQYTGFGYANTPVAVARKKSLRDKEYIYDENVLYTKKYFDDKLSKSDKRYLQLALESRKELKRTDYLECIQEKLSEIKEDVDYERD